MKKLLFFALIWSLSQSAAAQEWLINVGQPTPAFSVTAKDNTVISSEDLRGKVTLLNFFATWCPPCREELPLVQSKIWEVFGPRNDFALLVLAREEGWDKIDPFVESHGYSFSFFPDLNRHVFGLFAEKSIPRNVLLDKEGKIIYQSIGFSKKEFNQMVKVIKKELGKK